jgi:hypothetical protein
MNALEASPGLPVLDLHPIKHSSDVSLDDGWGLGGSSRDTRQRGTCQRVLTIIIIRTPT